VAVRSKQSSPPMSLARVTTTMATPSVRTLTLSPTSPSPCFLIVTVRYPQRVLNCLHVYVCIQRGLGGAKVTRLATSDSRPGAAFTFDRIFEPGCSQQLVFDTTTKPVLEDMLSGYYATVFAYGQTGSGKTFTMEVRRRCSVLHPTRSPHPERLQRRQQPPAETSRYVVHSGSPVDHKLTQTGLGVGTPKPSYPLNKGGSR
jgi:hypothetical protein